MIDHPSTAWSRRHLNTLPTTGTGRFLFLASEYISNSELSLESRKASSRGFPQSELCFPQLLPKMCNLSPVILNTEKEIEGSYNQRRGANRLNHARSCIKRESVRANRANASHYS